MSIEPVRKRSRRECAEAIKEVIAALTANQTNYSAAEAVCRDAAEEGGLAEEVWREPLEAAEEERAKEEADRTEIADIERERRGAALKKETALPEVLAVEPSAETDWEAAWDEFLSRASHGIESGDTLEMWEAKADDEGWELGPGQLREALQAKGLFICPPTQPEEDEAALAQSEGEADEPETETAPLWDPVAKMAMFGAVPVIPKDAEVILSKKQPLVAAKAFAGQTCLMGETLTIFHQGKFWAWNGSCYGEVDEQNIRTTMLEFLDRSRVKEQTDDGFVTAPYHPRPRDVNEVMDCLKSGLHLGVEVQAPMWMEGRPKGVPPAKGLLAFKNCLVDIMTGAVLKHTPYLWIHTALDFAYDPDALSPRWEQFLEEVFPGDVEAQEALEEQLGYCMTEDVRFHKGFMWIGKPRSGRGTITHIMHRLVGGSYVTLNFSTWLASENSRQPFIGKKVGVFPDVRLKPPKMWGTRLDPGGLDHRSAEQLLQIIGGDRQTIKLMWSGVPWEGVLPMKIILISNVTPRLNDEKGVLPTRFMKLSFGRSFAANPDLGLLNKLLNELPGIAVRCLRAYRRLCERGHFVQPKSGEKLDREVAMGGDPMTEWALSRLVVEEGGKGVKWSVLRANFTAWCQETGRAELLLTINTPSMFSKKLREVAGFENIWTLHPHAKDRVAVGVRFKTPEEKANDADE
jgi:putative DNA primase/helicase